MVAKKAKPSTKDMVAAAIVGLASRKGASLAAIKKYIASHYRGEVRPSLIRNALKSGCESGLFAVHHTHKGSYKMGKKKAPAKKKRAAPKRRAATKKRRAATKKRRTATKKRRTATKKRRTATKRRRAATKKRRTAKRKTTKKRRKTTKRRKSSKKKK
eukprot:g779.t1